ncbi:hypothetical protein Tco_0923322 [Tanacetum coccineum]|uniref:Uncharacterized protein n=1 Tax=Tanacetum coccineum TaxID=301880 RepID=A0ABQ5D1P3_9ASTR
MKTKIARYEIVGIEDMIPTLWSATKVGVYSTQKILIMVSVKVEKLHGYGQLEEIVVRRVDRQLYQFKEGDSDIVDFIVALRMFTRSFIIRRRVEDVQLGVESYQKKVNLTKPRKTFLGIEFKELYTSSFDPPGDGTLKTVRDELHRWLLDFLLGYNDDMPRRIWSVMDKRMTGLMVDLIDKKMLERRIIRNLERLVGDRVLEMDYTLMTRTE